VKAADSCREKAVRAGPPEVPATFLDGFLGIAGAAATALPGGGDNHMKSADLREQRARMDREIERLDREIGRRSAKTPADTWISVSEGRYR
jgi:hypothetical protein